MPSRYLIAAAVLFAAGCGSGDVGSLGDLGHSDWPQLETKLATDIPQTLADNESVYDRILGTDTAKAIHANGTPEFWTTMCESGSPLVSLLGFRCVAEKSQIDAFHAALAVLAHRGDASLYLFPEPLQLINDALPTDDNKNTFSKFVTDPKNLELQLDDVTAFLDEQFLQDWAVTAELQSVPGKVQSLAVGEVYAKSLEDGSSIPFSVATLFDSFDASSGDRLAVFVWYAPETTDRLTAAIERLLQDDHVSLGMYQIALSQRIDFVRSHIHSEGLELTPEHQQRYDRFREAAAKREGG